MPSTTPLRFEWITDSGRFLALRDDWNLLAASAVDTIFLTHAWLANWLQELAPEADLHVLTAREGERLVAALPLFGGQHTGTGRHWRIMGTGVLTPNHLDLVSDPALVGEARAGFVDLLLEASANWDVLEFDKLPADSGTVDAFASAFAQAGLATSCSESAVCYVCDLPPTYEEYLASRSKNTRKKIGETRRWLRKQPESIQLAVADTEEASLHALESLERFHQQRWEAKGYPGAFSDPRVVRFHDAEVRAAHASGNLRMYTLSDGDEILAVSYNFRVGATAQAYLTSFDSNWSKASPGVLLRAFVIEESIAEGATLFDWLEGAETYKKAWCTHERSDVWLRVYSRGLAGQSARLKHSAGVATVRLARKWVPVGVRESAVKALARIRASRQTGDADS